MTRRSGLAAIFLLVSASTSAMAATATPEEAQRLTAVFQAYLGKAPGVVTLAPAGEAYDMKIDFAPLVAKVAKPDFSIEIAPLEMKLTDRGGGKWLVTQDQPFSFGAEVPGTLNVSVKAGKLTSTGIFDESLQAFVSSTTELADFSVDETITVPGASPTHAAYAINILHYETMMKTADGGGVDGTVHADMTGIAESFAIPMSPGSATLPMDVNLTIAKGTQDSTVKGVRTKPILDLLAWLVAHPSPDDIKTNQTEFKNLLRAGLPLFENMAGTVSLETLSAMTPFGPVGIAKADIGVSMNGAVADGLVHEKLFASGLTLPAGLVPPWAIDLVPTTMTFDFNVAGFNLAAPAALVLDNLDLAKDPPLKPEIEQQLLQALLPKGTVTLALGPSGIVSKIADLGFEGSMTAGPTAMPAGQATVKAKGIDQVMEALKAAPPEMGMQQVITGLIAAKGMSKQDADGSLTWKIESTPSGGVLINGIDPSKM